MKTVGAEKEGCTGSGGTGSQITLATTVKADKPTAFEVLAEV